jgi:hypothetical protein
MSWVADGFRNAGNLKVPVNSLNLVSLIFSPAPPKLTVVHRALLSLDSPSHLAPRAELPELGTWNFVMRPL